MSEPKNEWRKFSEEKPKHNQEIWKSDGTDVWLAYHLDSGTCDDWYWSPLEHKPKPPPKPTPPKPAVEVALEKFLRDQALTKTWDIYNFSNGFRAGYQARDEAGR